MKNALKGIKVLDLTMNLPGPYMTWLMADMGAEVLKVENPETGDFTRGFSDPEQMTYFPVFEMVNRGKKGITLDLKQTSGKEMFFKLIKDYDIVVEGFRPGVLKKLGIDYKTASRNNPEIIYVSLSGYGQEGSYANKGGHDINYQALAGCFDPGSIKEMSPFVPTVGMADIGGGGLFALSGLLAAIIQRSSTGKGQHLDVSLTDGVFAFNIFSLCQTKKNMVQKLDDSHFLSGSKPFYYMYETLDNRHMSLGAVEPKFWEAFCNAVDRKDLIPMQYGGKKIIQQVADIFKTRSQADWTNLFRSVDACCEPVLTIKEAIDSDMGQERNFTQKDSKGLPVLNSPIKSIGEIPGQALEAPGLGRHNDKILGPLKETV